MKFSKIILKFFDGYLQNNFWKVPKNDDRNRAIDKFFFVKNRKFAKLQNFILQNACLGY